jgi:hypothetical protein
MLNQLEYTSESLDKRTINMSNITIKEGKEENLLEVKNTERQKTTTREGRNKKGKKQNSIVDQLFIYIRTRSELKLVGKFM